LLTSAAPHVINIATLTPISGADMKRSVKGYANQVLQKFDVAIVRNRNYQNLLANANNNARHDLDLLSQLPDAYVAQLLKVLPGSQSQLRQDLFVLAEAGLKRNGYFVEFGATDGKVLSNTYSLEKQFGWTGILAEPGHFWHAGLRINRACHVETDCVWRDSNSVLKFREVGDQPDLSTIENYTSKDHHSRSRKHGAFYDVKTISLNDLLAKYHAPAEIDYLSIDTEGSELEILSNFDFAKHHFRVITCEHNFGIDRAKIFSLLSENGYVRKFEHLSRFDDWYVGI
jgi:FkbM family methyltransferase